MSFSEFLGYLNRNARVESKNVGPTLVEVTEPPKESSRIEHVADEDFDEIVREKVDEIVREKVDEITRERFEHLVRSKEIAAFARQNRAKNDPKSIKGKIKDYIEGFEISH